MQEGFILLSDNIQNLVFNSKDILESKQFEASENWKGVRHKCSWEMVLTAFFWSSDIGSRYES